MADNHQSVDNFLRYLGDSSALNLCELIENDDDIDDDELKLYRTSPYYTLECLPEYLNKQDNTFKILSIDIQSLNAKFDSLKVYLAALLDMNIKFNAICIQETWLNNNSNTSIFEIDGYKLFSQNSHCSKHGGLAIYVDQEYLVTPLPENNIKTNVCEGMFLEISGTHMKNKLLIGNIYELPKHNNNDENIETFLTDIEQTLEKKVILPHMH